MLRQLPPSPLCGVHKCAVNQSFQMPGQYSRWLRPEPSKPSPEWSRSGFTSHCRVFLAIWSRSNVDPAKPYSRWAAGLGRRLPDCTLQYRSTLAYGIVIQFFLPIRALIKCGGVKLVAGIYSWSKIKNYGRYYVTLSVPLTETTCCHVMPPTRI